MQGLDRGATEEWLEAGIEQLLRVEQWHSLTNRIVVRRLETTAPGGPATLKCYRQFIKAAVLSCMKRLVAEGEGSESIDRHAWRPAAYPTVNATANIAVDTVTCPTTSSNPAAHAKVAGKQTRHLLEKSNNESWPRPPYAQPTREVPSEREVGVHGYRCTKYVGNSSSTK